MTKGEFRDLECLLSCAALTPKSEVREVRCLSPCTCRAPGPPACLERAGEELPGKGAGSAVPKCAGRTKARVSPGAGGREKAVLPAPASWAGTRRRLALKEEQTEA